MTANDLQHWLGWCALLNIVVLTAWWLMLWAAGDWIFRFHTRWFRLTRERFDAIHYAGLLTYKLTIYVLFIIPWLALVLMG